MSRLCPPALLALLLGTGACSSAPTTPRIGDVAWLAGSWAGEGKESTLVEVEWSRPKDGAMHGELRESRDGSALIVGTMRIVAGMNGVVLLGAPDGQQPRDFPLIEVSPGHAIFARTRGENFRVIEITRSGDELSLRMAGPDGFGGRREVIHELKLVGDPLR